MYIPDLKDYIHYVDKTPMQIAKILAFIYHLENLTIAHYQNLENNTAFGKNVKLKSNAENLGDILLNTGSILSIPLGDKRTLFVWFERVYGGYTVGNEVFLATRQRSQENVCFQRYKHHIPVRTTQTVYVYLHSNSD